MRVRKIDKADNPVFKWLQSLIPLKQGAAGSVVKEVAKATGIHQHTIYKWLNDKNSRLPNREQIKKIAVYMKQEEPAVDEAYYGSGADVPLFSREELAAIEMLEHHLVVVTHKNPAAVVDCKMPNIGAAIPVPASVLLRLIQATDDQD